MIQFRSFVRFIFAKKSLQDKAFKMLCTYATVMRSFFSSSRECFSGNLWLRIGFALIYTPIVIYVRENGSELGCCPRLRAVS